MFRSTTIIRELVMNLTKAIFTCMLKHSVKLRRYMLFGDVAACHRAACVLCAVQTVTVTVCVVCCADCVCHSVCCVLCRL
jgi:hypothetical protein